MEQHARTIGFKRGERNIFFHILTACNLSCLHCYINPAQHGREALRREELLRWLDYFLDPTKETNLIFLGGEPTLHPDLAAGVKHANRIGYHSVTIDTNGYLFHNILEAIDPAEAVLSFSVDGPNEFVNDPLRGVGSFRTCIANIEKAVQRGFSVSVICTVSKKNIDSLCHMPNLLSGLGIKRFFIQVVGIRGNSAKANESLQLTQEEWLGSVPPVAMAAAAQGMHVIYPKVFLESHEPFACAGNVAENFFIFPNGRVYLCPLCEDLPIHAFTMGDTGLKKNEGLVESMFFPLNIPEGCVMNKLLQPGNLHYDASGIPLYRISCCLLKQEIYPRASEEHTVL